MTEKQWKAYQQKVSRENLFMRFLDRWIPRLAWIAIILAAVYFGWEIGAWILR